MNIKELLPLIATILAFSPLTITFFRKTNPCFKDEMLAIKPYLWLIFIGAFYELIFTSFLRIPSAYWFTAYTFLEFLALWYFFRELLGLRYMYFFKATMFIVTVGFLIILYYWEYDIHTTLEAYLLVPILLFVFISSFIWFKDLFNKGMISLWIIPSFYFISGLIIYFSGGFFISLLYDKLKIVTGLSETNWLVFVSGLIIMYIMITIGVWKGTEKKP